MDDVVDVVVVVVVFAVGRDTGGGPVEVGRGGVVVGGGGGCFRRGGGVGDGGVPAGMVVNDVQALGMRRRQWNPLLAIKTRTSWIPYRTVRCEKAMSTPRNTKTNWKAKKMMRMLTVEESWEEEENKIITNEIQRYLQ